MDGMEWDVEWDVRFKMKFGMIENKILYYVQQTIIVYKVTMVERLKENELILFHHICR